MFIKKHTGPQRSSNRHCLTDTKQMLCPLTRQVCINMSKVHWMVIKFYQECRYNPAYYKYTKITKYILTFQVLLSLWLFCQVLWWQKNHSGLKLLFLQLHLPVQQKPKLPTIWFQRVIKICFLLTISIHCQQTSTKKNEKRHQIHRHHLENQF